MPALVNQEIYPGEFLLHKKYAQSELLLNLVWTHSNIVAEIATHLYDRASFDTSQLQREFVIQASLLHDIGVYACGGFEWMPNQPPCDKPYIQHTVVGAWILKQEGYHPSVVQVAHNHTGVGLTSQDITSFGLELPPEDYVPHTLLDQLISYAAKYHSKSPAFKTPEKIKESLARFGQEKIDKFEQWRQQFGEPDLTELDAKYKDWHQSFKFQIEHLSPQAGGGVSLNSAGIATR